MSTLPLTLNVDRPAPKISSQISKDGSTVSISASASTQTPFRNQPIRYTIKCIVRGAISKVAMDDITVPNAIVERQGKPDIHDQFEKGVPVRVVEIHYIITPLQAGKVTIPSAVLKGEIESSALGPMVDPFGGQFMTSPQAQQALNFFSAYWGDPFSVASNTIELDVKPPVGAMDPWLPLKSLKVEDSIDASQAVHVGEPLSRKITLRAEGAVGSQLPDLGDQQDNRDFKIYADKPEMGEDVDGNTDTISGWRKESYSMIPQRAGRLVLPAIKVKWWDIAKSKIALAELPEKVVHVLPAAGAQTQVIADAGAREAPSALDVQPLPTQRERALSSLVMFLYGVIAVFLVTLAFFAFRRRLLLGVRRPESNLTETVAAMLGLMTPHARRMLNQVHTVEELKDFLRAYAHQYWGKSKYASLEEIFASAANLRNQQDRADGEAIVGGINAALYAEKAADVEDLKRRCRRVLVVMGRATHGERADIEKLPLLNPS